jgi:hypothetical protein
MEKSNLSLADKIEKYSYMRPLSPEEIEEMRIELADQAIELKSMEDELKDIKDAFKIKMKPNKNRVGILLTLLSQKAEAVTEECHVIFEHDHGIAEYYNSFGVKVGSRPLLKDERNPNLLSELRKEATNNQ